MNCIFNREESREELALAAHLLVTMYLERERDEEERKEMIQRYDALWNIQQSI